MVSTASAARIVTITFGVTEINPISSNYEEGGFTFQVVSGTRWAVQSGSGNPGGELTTGFIEPVVGNQIDVFLTGGGPFLFSQFDFRKGIDNPPDTISFFGRLNGATTQTMPNFGGSSTLAYQTASTAFSATVDRVRIVIASVGNSAIRLDNLVLIDIRGVPDVVGVPEPGTGLLVAGAMAGLLAWRRK